MGFCVPRRAHLLVAFSGSQKFNLELRPSMNAVCRREERAAAGGGSQLNNEILFAYYALTQSTFAHNSYQPTLILTAYLTSGPAAGLTKRLLLSAYLSSFLPVSALFAVPKKWEKHQKRERERESSKRTKRERERWKWVKFFFLAKLFLNPASIITVCLPHKAQTNVGSK